MKESERILFTDFLASMNKKFIESGWITVSAECLHSVLFLMKNYQKHCLDMNGI